MKTKVRKIGNSKGIILAKSILEQCAITDEVKVSVVDSKIVIEAVQTHPRDGWEEQLIKAGSLQDDENKIEDFGNEFDAKEWTW